jgi:hypothetical protein
MICFPCVLDLVFVIVGFHAPNNTSPIIQGCEPWDFNSNTKRNKGNYNGMNESKGACCSKITTIRFRVANFEKKEGGLEKRLGIETRGVEHEENHNSLQQKRGILRSKYHRKQQRKKFMKTHSCEPQFLANS